LYQALERLADTESSRFVMGTGVNRGKLIVKEINQPLSLKTLQNNWPTLRNDARNTH
jgi:hypothetical protein